MADYEEEPNRVLGIPWRPDAHARQGEESQRVMGFPVDGLGSIDRDWVWSLAHPIRGYRRWLHRRCLGPYAVDEDGPGRRR